ncbi:MAG: hypothetical protein JKY56_12375 [Kofleriaceae bacterium]|nr:hypothetical protein [Kofleriaceae bacterium]
MSGWTYQGNRDLLWRALRQHEETVLTMVHVERLDVTEHQKVAVPFQKRAGKLADAVYSVELSGAGDRFITARTANQRAIVKVECESGAFVSAFNFRGALLQHLLLKECT